VAAAVLLFDYAVRQRLPQFGDARVSDVVKLG